MDQDGFVNGHNQSLPWSATSSTFGVLRVFWSCVKKASSLNLLSWGKLWYIVLYLPPPTQIQHIGAPGAKEYLCAEPILTCLISESTGFLTYAVGTLCGKSRKSIMRSYLTFVLTE